MKSTFTGLGLSTLSLAFCLTGCNPEKNETTSGPEEKIPAVDPFAPGTPPSDKSKGDPAELYFRAYTLLQEGEKVDTPAAQKLYAKALVQFEAVKKTFPKWKPQMVDTRIKDVKSRLLPAMAGE